MSTMTIEIRLRALGLTTSKRDASVVPGPMKMAGFLTSARPMRQLLWDRGGAFGRHIHDELNEPVARAARKNRGHGKRYR